MTLDNIQVELDKSRNRIVRDRLVFEIDPKMARGDRRLPII